MNRKKIREFVKQAHPNRKIVEPAAGKKYAVESDAQDVDVDRLSPQTWQKFRASSAAKSGPPQASTPALRERFRPRKLTGAGPAPTKSTSARLPGASSREAGKLALERLVPEDAAADADNALDVLVDEDHGVIGESDSGTED